MAFATGANERVDCVEGSCRRAWRSVAENGDDGGKRCQPTSPTWGDQARRHAECSRRMQRRTVVQLRGRATPEDVRWPSPSWLGSLSRRVVIEVWPEPFPDAVIGEVDGGWAQLMSGLNIERLILAAMQLGVAERAFDECLRFVSEREQFGRPVGKFQVLRHRIADMATESWPMPWSW